MQRCYFILGLATVSLFMSGIVRGGAKFNKQVDIGDSAPVWKGLPGIDGQTHGLKDLKGAKVVVVAFTCNRCPVSRMYEDRFVAFAAKHKQAGVALVAVNCSNDPRDRIGKMKQRALEKKFPFDYLRDDDQSLGRDFGVAFSHQIFVLDGDRKIAYMGAFDDAQVESQVRLHYVRDAVDALLAGRKPEIEESRPQGCRIKYGKR